MFGVNGRLRSSGPSVFKTPPSGGGGAIVGNEVEKREFGSFIKQMIEWMSNESLVIGHHMVY